MARMSTIIKRFLIREIFETIWNSVEISILSNIESSYCDDQHVLNCVLLYVI